MKRALCLSVSELSTRQILMSIEGHPKGGDTGAEYGVLDANKADGIKLAKVKLLQH